MSTHSVVTVIPARYGSTRLPAKPLADINGKPMIQWVYERSSKARGVARTIVATDDERIASVVRGFGGEAIMTSPELASGTDRVAAVADQVKGDIFVNVQGDEPLIVTEAIEKGVELVRSGRFPMGTVMTPLRNSAELHERSVVKVIADSEGRAIYFSRLPIPYGRGPEPSGSEPFVCRRHVGLYVYDRATLMRFRALPPSPLERAEVLEQLRALAAGIPIGIAEVNFTSIGVDTAEDLAQVRKVLV
ncbi:MAG: 3-deoxy-manno-octulosonate cytidylyltransferase [Oligoflexia bacterium]|nr:3-deoxy-manno-octulosonate cytidylyltransferase [Oligoflexia bacterium]